MSIEEAAVRSLPAFMYAGDSIGGADLTALAEEVAEALAAAAFTTSISSAGRR